MNTKEQRTANGMDLDKHTPGPWTIQWGGHDFPMIVQEGCSRPVHDYEQQSICTVLKYGATRPFEKNAELIAAAPDLLEALENALDMLRFHASVEFAKTGDYMDALAQADSAIRKAKGE